MDIVTKADHTRNSARSTTPTMTTLEGTMNTETPEQLAARKRVVNRLKRANGQLAALITQVEAGAECRDIVTQLSAVSSALDKAGFAIISSAMKDCVLDPERQAAADDAEASSKKGPLTLTELEKLFLTLA